MNYVREINFVVLVLALIAFAIATGLAYLLTRSDIKRERMADKIEHMEKAHAKRVADLVAALQEQAREITVLQGDKADLHDALIECQEMHKASQRQTVEVEAVKPAKPRHKNGQFAKKEASE